MSQSVNICAEGIHENLLSHVRDLTAKLNNLDAELKEERSARIGLEHLIAPILLAQRPVPQLDGTSEARDPSQDPVEEVGTNEAARILGCSKDMVLRYRKERRLPFRDIAVGGNRPVFRFPRSAVIELRTNYEVASPQRRSAIS